MAVIFVVSLSRSGASSVESDLPAWSSAAINKIRKKSVPVICIIKFRSLLKWPIIATNPSKSNWNSPCFCVCWISSSRTWSSLSSKLEIRLSSRGACLVWMALLLMIAVSCRVMASPVRGKSIVFAMSVERLSILETEYFRGCASFWRYLKSDASKP